MQRVEYKDRVRSSNQQSQNLLIQGSNQGRSLPRKELLTSVVEGKVSRVTIEAALQKQYLRDSSIHKEEFGIKSMMFYAKEMR